MWPEKFQKFGGRKPMVPWLVPRAGSGKMESSSQEIDAENHPVPSKFAYKGKTDATSIEIADTKSECIDASLSEKLVQCFANFHRNSMFSVNICEVPDKLRKVNKDAFIPRLVSIGPYHREKPHLQAMEMYKLRCLDRYEKRCSSGKKLIINEILRKEIDIRLRYEKTFDEVQTNDFVEMMLLDAIFILEFLTEATSTSRRKNKKDGSFEGKIFENNWMTCEIIHDLMLLENQIPWFVLSFCLSHEETNGITEQHASKLWLDHFSALIKYFKKVGVTCPPEVILTQNIDSNLVEILWTSIIPKSPFRPPTSRGKPEYIRTATELQEAGVKFEKGEERTLTDIHYLNGVLTIPLITVNEWTETLLRNVIAFEQCQYGRKKFVTGYVIFMDSLIDTSEDVDLLIKSKVLENLLGDKQQVADLFNNLHKEILRDNKDFYFARHCEELNEYSRDSWHQWKATWFCAKRALRRDYFNSPWTGLSVFAAVFVILLTIIQTVCSILQVIPTGKT